MIRLNDNEVKLGPAEKVLHNVFNDYLNADLGIRQAIEKTQEYADRMGYGIAADFWEWLEP